MTSLPPPRDDELLDLDALIAHYGVERARARPRLVGIIGGLWSWFLGLSLAAKILVGVVAIAGLMYVARLLQRPSFDLNVPRTYGFSARRNTTGLGLHIPIIYGEHRHFPPIINQYIDVVGDKEYLYTLYAVSEGPIERISDVEVNEQPIERYQEVSWQARLGTPDQEAIPWFADTRNTYAVGVELLDDGRSFIYRTLRRVDRFIVKVKIPAAGGAAGLSTSAMSMTVRVEHRREGDAAWTALPDVVITANTRKPVTRQIDSGDLGQVARAYAGTVQNDSTLSGTAWTNPTNAQGAPNDTWASVNEPTSTPRDTQYLRSSGHGFAIPGGATITGLELRVERHHVPEGASGPPNDWLPEGPFSSFDRSVRLCRAGAVVGEDKAVTGTAWPLTDTLRIYGGPGDLWGETWTPADINDSGFGAAIAARVDQGTCRVDAMELRVYYTLAGADLARREIRVTRVTTSTSDKPPLTFDSVDEILYGTDLNRYANVAVLGVKIQASEQLSGEPKVSALVRGRKVRPLVGGALNPTELWTRNPVECLVDLLTHARYGLGRGGLTDDHLVLSSFQAAKDYCDELIDRGDGQPETRHELDVVIDEKTIWEWVQDLIPNVFRGGLVESDGRYRLFFDHQTPISQIFTDANIVRGTFETSWLSISEQYDQVELFYLDRDQYYFRDSVLFPATGTKRKVIEARGITRRTHATREARYHHHLTSLLARSVQFDASLDAIACDVGDVIGVSHSLPHSGDPTSPWAFSGRVVAVATADAGANHVITVDRGDLPTQGLGGYGLLVRLQNDTIEIKNTVLSVSAPYTSAEGYPRQDVRVSGLFAATPAARDSLWAFGPVTQVTRPFRVLAQTLNANRTRKITAFEYREFADEARTVPIYEPALPSYAYALANPASADTALRSADGNTWEALPIPNAPGLGWGWFDQARGLDGLWLEHGGDRIWRTANAGGQWTELTTLPLTHRGGAIILRDSGVLLVTAATQSGNITIMRSADAGQTWAQITVDVAANFVGLGYIPAGQMLWQTASGAVLLAVIDPNVGNNQRGIRVYRSTNDGETWTLVLQPDFPTNQTQQHVRLHLTVRGDVCWACAWNEVHDDLKLFRSINGGATWNEPHPFGVPTTNRGQFATPPRSGQNPILMADGSWVLFVRSKTARARTRDDGGTWSTETGADALMMPVGCTVRGISYISRAATPPVQRSLDHGTTWANDAQFGFAPHIWFTPAIT